MTVSNIASILVRAEVVEMPCVCYYSQIDFPEGLPPGYGFIFWSGTVPAGKKLVVKRCGVMSYGSDPSPGETVVIETEENTYEYNKIYNEPNLEFSSGTFVKFMVKNTGTNKKWFGAWVMFDFVTE